MHERLEKPSTSSSRGGQECQKYLLHDANYCLDKSLFLLFEDISYSVRSGILTRERKKLLNNIYGDFRPGELTAIMGASGSGKSTLMDVLAGFTTYSVTGKVTVNGQQRDLSAFRRSSAYIMQNDNLQPLLTVQEAMLVAADLKLTLNHSEKLKRIDEILIAIGLDESRYTQTGDLSGGQRKRLTIALELVNNPPVMFFDEPTSGLDSVTSKQCLGLLRQLAHEGRTIICSIHQPSALLFYMIDHLYVLADGYCVYTGSTRNLVPYLNTHGLSCPIHYNPADFLMEVCNGDYGQHVPKLTESIENGKNNSWRSDSMALLGRQEVHLAQNMAASLKALNQIPKELSIETEYEHTTYYPTSFWTQLSVLLRRNVIRLSRDRVLTYTRLIMHVIIALLVGTLYFRIGQDAAYVLDNFNLLFFSIMFLMFSAFSAALTTFPSEVPMITKEHFNRWYKLRSFYLANKLADLPVQITAILLYTVIVYYMSDQFPEWRRFALYVMISIIISLVAQAFGLIVGTGLSMQNGIVFGSLAIMPFVIFSGFFVHLNDAHPYMHWLFHISFLKYGFEGVMVTMYGYDRPKMRCSEDYCHFAVPEKLLIAVDMRHANYWFCMVVLIGLYLGFDLMAYVILRIRLKMRCI